MAGERSRDGRRAITRADPHGSRLLTFRPSVLAAGAFAAGLVGALVFAAILTGTGEWMDGRRLSTVAGWAIPGLFVSVAALAAALRAMRSPAADRRPVLVLGLLAAAALALLWLVNPPIAPPVY